MRALKISSQTATIEKLLETIEYNIFIADLNGKIIYCSEYVCRSFEINKNEIINQHIRMFNNELVFDTLIDEMEQFRQSAVKEAFDFTVNNKTVSCSWYFIPIFNSEEHLSRIIILIANKKDSQSLTINVFSVTDEQKVVQETTSKPVRPVLDKLKSGWSSFKNFLHK